MPLDPLPLPLPLLQQRLAIEAPLGAVLVVAGPGAGKTFCLTSRIGHMIAAHGVDPARICAVTFTNRAAEEIAARLRHALGASADAVTRGTIHALCLQILRAHAEAAGLRPGFGVADEDYQHVILGRLGVHAERRAGVVHRFGRHRLQGHTLERDDAQLYRQYAAYLAHGNMVDFDGLITQTAGLLAGHGDVADAVAARWDHLLVDEFQDVNAQQYDILKRLAARHGNLFAVGDDEQSIFSWTGADPFVLERFRRDYAIERPIVLDRNCRSSRQIFETARRMVAHNPQLFEKALSAERQSEHEVRAVGFADEEEETAWLLDDLCADRTASGLGWGDYAILYRKHAVGAYLEGRLLRAGIPCRLPRGRALIEDEVIRYVIAALRVVRNADDPVAVTAFARVVLSSDFFQEVEAAIGREADFLPALRGLAAARPKHDPGTRKLWRLVYQVENLRALTRSHHSVAAVVDEILSQSVGPYRNVLEEHHEALTDPLDLPPAVRLAERLERAAAGESRVVIAAEPGLEIALRGMLGTAGIRDVAPAGTAPRAGDALVETGLTLFKALQLMHARNLDAPLERYVTFDLETTDSDVTSCGVVEIGAVRVAGTEIVARYHTLVQPYGPISPAATQIHGYSAADLAGARSFAEVWPEFRAFVGDDLLIAHNGQRFDIPVLRRLAAGREGLDTLAFYDSFLLARSLLPTSAAQQHLAAQFGIEPGRAHHALDDAMTLAHIYRELERRRTIRARKAVLVNLLDYLGLALALEHGAPSDEQDLLLGLARVHTLGRYGEALELYASEVARTGVTAPPVEDVIERLGGRALMARLAAEPDPAERYPVALSRLRALMDPQGSGGTLPEQIDRLLERVALSTSAGVEVAPDRVNLLTLHSTKGLEFSRVYVVGVEDYELPGYKAATEQLEDEIQEARRLLYVGMTRAKDRLVLTRVERRFGRDAGGSAFLEEMGLAARGVADSGNRDEPPPLVLPCTR